MRSLKKIYIKLISHYHYGVVVYNFTHPKNGIYRVFLKVCIKIHSVCVCKGKKGIFKIFINLKTTEKPMVNN